MQERKTVPLDALLLADSGMGEMRICAFTPTIVVELLWGDTGKVTNKGKKMIHWMLVLFVGTGDSVPALKTDLVFASRNVCFEYEDSQAKSNIESINALMNSMKREGKSQDEIIAAMTWTGRQLPRGTCIPTTLPVTVK